MPHLAQYVLVYARLQQKSPQTVYRRRPWKFLEGKVYRRLLTQLLQDAERVLKIVVIM